MEVMSETNKLVTNNNKNNDKNKAIVTTTTNTNTKIRGIENGWFTETATMWPGQKFSLALKGTTTESILFHKKSEYQEILIFQSAQYGKVFVIDGIVQLTERDSFTFHEMMAHLPLFAHKDPKKVLIVGGGDGMILQQVCRHKEVEQITIVEIDPMVIQACKEHLKTVPPDLFDDPRVEIVLADAADYLRDPASRDKFDIILADTLDPLGPGESLFEPEFYESMYAALRPNGIACTQGENIWIHFDLVRDLVACCADIFDRAEYATTSVPSFPCGQIGFVLARKGSDKSCSVPVRKLTFQDELRWYNPQMHRAAFVLPQYIKMELNAPDVVLNGVGTNGGTHHDYDFDDHNDDDDEGDRCLFAGCTIQ